MILLFNSYIMPNLDGTGPEGKGATGRKRGTCTQAENSPRKFCCLRGQGRFMHKNNECSLEEEEKLLLNRLAVIRKEKENS